MLQLNIHFEKHLLTSDGLTTTPIGLALTLERTSEEIWSSQLLHNNKHFERRLVVLEDL
jgi:hypothetical protein